MTRRGKVPWKKVGKDVMQVVVEEYRRDPKHYLKESIARLEGSIPQLSLNSLECWLRGQDKWVAVKAQIDNDPEHVHAQLASERLRQQRTRVYKKEMEALKALTGEQSLRKTLETLVRDTVPSFGAIPPYIKAKTRGKRITEETLLLLLSDWHAYEMVDPERTRGINSYNARIFGQRAHQIIHKVLGIKDKIEAGNLWRFPHAVVGLNGDMVSGTLHEVERHTDAHNIVMAVYGCAYVLAQSLRDLAHGFKSVEVFCSPGNHGRLPDARRMQDKDPSRNWDTLIYIMAREMLRDVPRVKWFIPNSYSVAFSIYSWNFLQTHGHDIKSWNNIPWYGMQRAVSNISALEAARGTVVNYFLWGHFHQKIAMEEVSGESIVNGSLIGATEWSLAKFNKAPRPTQWMLGVHPEWGITHRWSLDAMAPPDAPGYVTHPWEGADGL